MNKNTEPQLVDNLSTGFAMNGELMPTISTLEVMDTAEAIAIRKGVPVHVFSAVASSWEVAYYIDGDTAEEATAYVLRLIENTCEAGLSRIGALFALDAIITAEAGNAFEAYSNGRSYAHKALVLSLIEAGSMVSEAFNN